MRNLRVLFLFLFLCAPWSLADADEWHYPDVDRIVAIGDVHGAYDALVETLQAADVIDSNLSWNGGKTHLVFTGDLLDRGAKSRQVMDLIMRLEKEARRRGGHVHLLLGNHEVMNLNGDLRYVADAEYAAYQDVESKRDREHWFKNYLASQPGESDEVVVRAEFDTLAPPGFFGHREAFRHNGKYGKWLLKKPFIVVINDTAFVHGGLPYFVAEHGLEGVNIGLKNDLSFYVSARDQLADQKILSPIYRFKQVPALLKEKRDANQIHWRYQETVQAAIELSKSPLHTPIGPTWYRGTATCSALVEGDVLASAFAKIDASRVVMGHTSTITRKVQQRANGRTVEIDTGMLKESYQGSGNALIIEGDRLSVANQDGRSDLSPVAHPIRVGHESISLGDDELAIILSQGNLVELPNGGEPRHLVVVTSDEVAVFARFSEIQDDRFAPEIAAYRLDRMLGLGMVPVAIRREINGQPVTLQLAQANGMTDVVRVVIRAGIGAPCSIDKQAAAMRVFDALIGNSARTPSTMLYDSEEMLLILVGHDAAFGTAWPGHSAVAELSVGKDWQTALRELDGNALGEELGDVLDGQQLAELEQRRDALLNSAND